MYVCACEGESVCVYLCLCLVAFEGCIYMVLLNIFIYSPTLSYSHLFCRSHFTLYIVQVISLSASVFYLSERAMNGREIITITHIIEQSL